MTQTLAFNVFLSLGTVASLLSLIIGLWKYRRLYQILNLGLVLGLTVFASYSFFTFQELRDKERTLERQKALAKAEAAALLDGLPTDISYWRPGEGRGVALAGLAFLEQHKHPYPETFELALTTIRSDMKSAQSQPDTSGERHTMETAGTAMIQMLRAKAGRKN